jgi:hypothetical protein
MDRFGRVTIGKTLNFPQPLNGKRLDSQPYSRTTHGGFRADALFPAPPDLALKIEQIVESCRLFEHLEVTDRFFKSVLHRAQREGYYSETEANQALIRLGTLIERKGRLLNKVEEQL